jgi:hypothetical protein
MRLYRISLYKYGTSILTKCPNKIGTGFIAGIFTRLRIGTASPCRYAYRTAKDQRKNEMGIEAVDGNEGDL